LVILRLDAEQVCQFILPLTDERLRNDQQDALGTFGATLGNNQASLNRLPQTNFVGKNTSAFTETAQGKNHSIYLVRIGIDTRVPLGRCVALQVVRPTHTHEIFGNDALVERV
jgi:hypothetical protein